MSESLLTTTCPACGKSARVAAKFLGKTAKCPGCGKAFQVQATPGSSAAAVPATTAAPAGGAPGDLPPGTKLGNFEIVKLLAHGSMGPVYEANDVLLARAVALKALPPALVARGGSAVAEFLSKANVSNRLEHANILTVYQAGRQGDLCFFVEELVRGGSAGEFVRQYGPMRPDDALRSVIAAAKGLAYAHQRNTVHGNVHPNNILLGQEWTVKIADFGLSTALETVGLLSRTDRPAEFLSPEYCAGRPTDIRSDIYSLGASFYYMLTGEPPFPSPDRATMFVHHVSTPAPDPRAKKPEIPDFVAEAILKAMAKNPEERFATSGEMAAALEGSSAASAPAADLPLPVDFPLPPRPIAEAAGRGSSGANRVLNIRRQAATQAPVNWVPITAGGAGLVVLVIVLMLVFGGGSGNPGKDSKDAKKDKDGAAEGGRKDAGPVAKQPPDGPPDPLIPDPPDPVEKKKDDDPVTPLPPLKGKTPPRTRTVGERFAELNSKVLRLADDGDPAELGRALRDMNELADQTRRSPDPDMREFARNADEVYRKHFGRFYSERLAMNLPAANRNWPGLSRVPQKNGFYRLVDGKAVNVHLSGGERQIRDGELIIEANLQAGGYCIVTPNAKPTDAPAFTDFELWYDMLKIGDSECFIWYRAPPAFKGAFHRLHIDQDEVQLVHGNNIFGDRAVAEHKFEATRNGWIDLRLVVRGNSHTAYINGEKAFSHTSPAGATRPGDLGLLVIGGRIAVRDARLAIYDKEPGKAAAPVDPNTGIEGEIRSSGSGFAVTDGGHILTNHHVVRGAKRVYVGIPGVAKPVPAQVIGQDAVRDMAVLRIPADAAAKLRPLPLIAERVPARGEKVAAFGFPLGDVLGEGLKLTAGAISARPEKENDDMLLLDVKVNPGNSGGPLCDSTGAVVGMITAKSFSDERTDSFGMALTSPELDRFLRRHVAAYKPVRPVLKRLDWDEVDRIVSGSVVRVLNAQ